MYFITAPRDREDKLRVNEARNKGFEAALRMITDHRNCRATLQQFTYYEENAHLPISTSVKLGHRTDLSQKLNAKHN